MSTQNANQFSQTPVVGSLDLQTNSNPAVFTCRFKDASEGGATLLPGEGVKLVDLGANDFAGPPIVDERATTDVIFGVKIFTTKENTAEDGDIVQIAGDGAVIFMNAGAAILRGAEVELVDATPGNVITSAATNRILGVCLDKATAANQTVRILIKERAA